MALIADLGSASLFDRLTMKPRGLPGLPEVLILRLSKDEGRARGLEAAAMPPSNPATRWPNPG
jgi:hypothetical protein